MRTACLILAMALAILLPQRGAAAEDIPQLFLIQNSGWMEPFYTDPHSAFLPVVKRLVAAAGAGSPIIIAAFNQDGQVPGRVSPEEKYRGPGGAAGAAAAIDGIDLPKKPNGAFADSDFSQALTTGIERVLGGRSGIIWMVTNNQNAPGNTANWAERNRDFFHLVQQSDAITRIYAYPVRGAASGETFGRREGFIIYAMAYGKAAAAALDKRMESPEMRALLSAPPVRLKPLDRQTIAFEIEKSNCRMVAASWIELHVKGGKRVTCVLEGRLRNRLYPQTIEQAVVDVTLRPDSRQPGLAGTSMSMEPHVIRNVPALGVSDPVRITLQLPALKRDGLADTETRAAGLLAIALNDIRYGWDADFLNRLSAVPLGGDLMEGAGEKLVRQQLPDIFLTAGSKRQSRTDLPIQVVASHSRLLMWALVLLPLAALLAWLMLRRSGRKEGHEFDVDLDGERHKVRIRQGDRQILTNGRGMRFAVTGRGRQPPQVVPLPD